MSALPVILVLAPHPDDELVGAAISMSRLIAAGGKVSVLYLTTGVAAEGWPWERHGYERRVARRRQEALRAAHAVGFSIENELDIPSRRLIDHLGEVQDIVSHVQADQLWVPAFEGGHQDHDAANALGFALRGRFQVVEFAEYNFLGGRVNANCFPNGSSHPLLLSEDERALKKRLLQIYESEAGNLGYVGCAQESLRPLEDHDYARPAHDGRLFRERFHWVPFRHPRIDWRKQSEISEKLVSFLF